MLKTADRVRIGRCGVASLCGIASVLAFSAPSNAQVGLSDLIARIGAESTPTGAGVVVSLVEAADGNGNYRPNLNNSEFLNKSFTLMSGASGNSSHATLVGRHFFGLDTSIAPGISSIFCYEANGWIQNHFLRAHLGATTLPLATPQGVKIFNNSWVGPPVPIGIDNPILRRADFVITRDDLLIISGVMNENPQRILMSHQYNGLSVGMSNGNHATTDTVAGVDGPGRMKPEIVAPATTTSVATAITSAAAALMVETARTTPLDANPLAERSEVIKAVLLGGANRGQSWANNAPTTGPLRGLATRPLNDVLGAGEVNINTSHLILTGGQFASMDAHDEGPGVCRTGWDLGAVGPGESRYLRFRLPIASETMSVSATWHRIVGPTNMNTWSVANFDLHLWRVDASGDLIWMVGNAGQPYFTSGNVASMSGVDNVELLHVRDLQPGDYVIEVRRIDATGSPVDVAVSWLMDSAERYGDINGDGIVNVFDLLALLAAWGPCPDDAVGCTGDLDCNGIVNVFDLLRLLADWG